MKPEADKPGLPDNLRALALAARARVQKLPAVGPIVAEQGPNHGYLESPYAEDDWELWACLLLDAFGTRSPNVANAFMSQLADLCPDVWLDGECQGLDAYKFELVVAIVKAMKPRNEAEAALACQAAALHLATMKVGSRLSQSSYVDPRSAASLAMLGKAYARQLETLSAMQGTRKSVRQVIRVEKNVTLNYSRDEKHFHLRGEGGGYSRSSTYGTGGQRARARDAAMPPECSALPSASEVRAMPVASGEGEEGLPLTWRREGLGRTEGTGER